MSVYANAAEVHALIERLYKAFDEPNDLLSDPAFSPIREDFVLDVLHYTRDTLPNDLVDLLAWRLVTSVGTPQTLRHYLPRIFRDALTLGGLDTTPWEVFVERVAAADFDDWSEDRRRLTLQAFKFWIANEIALDQGLSGRDFPELSPEALAGQTSLQMLTGLVEVRHGIQQPIAFLRRAEISLA
jgi:hypothetical protein